MSYQFKPADKGIRHGVQRIAGEQIDKALALLDGPRPLNAEQIHSLRTTVKKLRGLLRLIRPGLAEAKREDAAFRDASRAISASRDSEVMLATLSLLAADGLSALRAALQADHAAAHADHVLDAGLETYRSEMEGVRARLSDWHIAGKGFEPLAEGLAQTFGAARKAMAAARRDPVPERLHEWRKLVKAHGYQARLLAPIWPALMEPHLAVATDLGELLGQMNDLAVFEARLAALPIPEEERAEATGRARARHAEVTARALPMGAFLFAERPEALAHRWQAWWELWREEGQSAEQA